VAREVVIRFRSDQVEFAIRETKKLREELRAALQEAKDPALKQSLRKQIREAGQELGYLRAQRKALGVEDRVAARFDPRRDNTVGMENLATGLVFSRKLNTAYVVASNASFARVQSAALNIVQGVVGSLGPLGTLAIFTGTIFAQVQQYVDSKLREERASLARALEIQTQEAIEKLDIAKRIREDPAFRDQIARQAFQDLLARETALARGGWVERSGVASFT
jgi:uncharacterized Ntn-hydrolase superfamily protein